MVWLLNFYFYWIDHIENQYNPLTSWRVYVDTEFVFLSACMKLY